MHMASTVVAWMDRDWKQGKSRMDSGVSLSTFVNQIGHCRLWLALGLFLFLLEVRAWPYRLRSADAMQRWVDG